MDFYGADEDDDDGFEDSAPAARDKIVFLLDSHPLMFRPIQAEAVVNVTSLFDLCLRVCVDVMRHRIIVSPKDELSVIFYGTAGQDNPENFAHVYVFQELDVTTAQRIKSIGCLTNELFEKEIGSAEDSVLVWGESLTYGLWTATNLLDDKSKTAKTVLLLTGNPDPCGSSSQLSDRVLTRVDQMRAAGIQLKTFLLPTDNKAPATDFWKTVNDRARISADLDDFEEDVLLRLENLSDVVRKRAQPKRSLASLTLTLIKDIRCSVKLYALVRPAAKGKAVKLDSRTNEELVASTAYICSDTGAKMEKIEHYCFQPERVEPERYPPFVMTEEELKKAKEMDIPSGIRILGFQSYSALRDYHQIAAPIFLYPDEQSLQGSTTTFIGLHENMLQHQTIAICQFRKNNRSPARIGVLIAQQEVLDENGRQLHPPGMHLIDLPFRDEIRRPDLDPKIVGENFCFASTEQVEAGRRLVEKLTLPEDFTTADVPNPHIQRHYQVLESLALMEEIPPLDEFVDETLPDTEMLEKHSDVIVEYRKAVYGDDAQMEESSSGRKRRSGVDEDVESFVARTDWIALAQNDNLGSLTIQKLKMYLELHGLAVSGRKAELISRIKAHLATE